MVDNLTPRSRRKNMQRIRSKDTLPERVMFAILRDARIYFAKHVSTLPGKPDIVFRKKRLAVFVDSDFWHGHPTRGTKPKSNRAYWNRKIANNQERDRRVNRILRAEGWKVLRLWEFDIKKSPKRCLSRILRALQS